MEDAHSGCDMKVLDHMDEKVKISRYPKGVAYTGLDVEIKLPRMGEFEERLEDISNIFADEDESASSTTAKDI